MHQDLKTDSLSNFLLPNAIRLDPNLKSHEVLTFEKMRKTSAVNSNSSP